MRPHELRAGSTRSRAGFATVLVLGLVAVVALLCAGTLHDALFGEQLATSRMLHQRAGALAELGIEDAMARLAADPSPATQSWALASPTHPNESAGVSLRSLGNTTLPAGSSAGRIIARHFQIESTGTVARGIQAVQVQGVMQLAPAMPQSGTETMP